MSGNDAPKVTFFESPVSGWAQVPYNTREILTESGEWESPITGYVKVTCIGGGQAGLSITGMTQESWTIQPGNATQFKSVTAKGGATKHGGAAGEVVTDYVKVEYGEKITYIVGSGGPVAVFSNPSNIDLSKYCQFYPAGVRNSFYVNNNNYSRGLQSVGGHNGTAFGGGGGGGVYVGLSSMAQWGADGGGNGGAGAYSVAASAASGGKGGNGAIILEYADPKKKD